MYCPSDSHGHFRSSPRPEGKLICQFEAVSFDQSPDAGVQASLEYLTVVYENELAGNALTCLTSGTAPTQGWAQRALDFSYLPSRSKRISAAISIMAFALDQDTSYGLQYFADDYATWLGVISQGPDSTGIPDFSPEGMHRIQSNDSTAGSDSSSPSAAGEEALHFECVVLKATLCLKADGKVISLEATDIDATVQGITGNKVKAELHTIACVAALLMTGPILLTERQQNRMYNICTRDV
ncbi:hypothetical protein QFC22_002776 [Naganishia vaughanmartiniae]|uniref:Uncharacterized protein n=1 Tax=Naganishia vaughanmartiniae TaxID=1424756 RepID=A0ACC2XDM6_9TREE|nr:hypothetical protein QFC22_002776 [Naganishia vaughanmartiniae]